MENSMKNNDEIEIDLRQIFIVIMRLQLFS